MAEYVPSPESSSDERPEVSVENIGSEISQQTTVEPAVSESLSPAPHRHYPYPPIPPTPETTQAPTGWYTPPGAKSTDFLAQQGVSAFTKPKRLFRGIAALSTVFILLCAMLVWALWPLQAYNTLLSQAPAHVEGVVDGEDATQLEAGREAIAPIAGAKITCGKTSSKTNAKGVYSLSLPRNTRYTCSVSAPSYVTTQVPVQISNVSVYTINFQSRSGLVTNHPAIPCLFESSGMTCTILLLQNGSLTGVVQDRQTHQPVANELVQCWLGSSSDWASETSNKNPFTLTNAQGQYTLSMATGVYGCVVGKDSTPQSVVARPTAITTLNFSICQKNCSGVSYHGGDVLHSLMLYLIFWTPPGVRLDPNVSNERVELIYEQFVKDLGGSSFYGMLGQYWDNNGPVQNNVILGGTTVDTNPYPEAGTRAHPLSDVDVRVEVSKETAQNNWPVETAGVEVAVITGYNIEECSGQNRCTFATNTNKGFCAYHSWDGCILPGDIASEEKFPYVYIPNLSRCNIRWEVGYPPSPTGAPDTDTAINEFSHEIFESVTDPYITG